MLLGLRRVEKYINRSDPQYQGPRPAEKREQPPLGKARGDDGGDSTNCANGIQRYKREDSFKGSTGNDLFK